VKIPSGEATLGPFFPRRYVDAGANDLTQLDGHKADGEAIEIAGMVRQEDGTPLDNLVLEIWQADAQGRYDNPAFFGWGRAATDAQGVYLFKTVQPGAPPGRAAHINFLLLYSGLMRQLQTVMFFGAQKDPVLDSVAAKERLIARKRDGKFVFDLRLRGEGETPFFDD